MLLLLCILITSNLSEHQRRHIIRERNINGTVEVFKNNGNIFSIVAGTRELITMDINDII